MNILKLITKFIRYLYAEQPTRLVLVFSTLLLTSLLEGAGVALLVPLLSLVSSSQEGLQPSGRLVTATQHFFSAVGLPLTVTSVLVFIFLLVVTQQALGIIQQKLFFGSLYRFESNLRLKLYRAIFKSSWPFFLKQKIGHLTSALTVEVTRAGAAYAELNLLLAAYAIMFIYICLAAAISLKMTLATALTGASLVLLLRGRLARAIQFGNDITKVNSDLLSEATEQISSAKLIKGCAIEESTIAKFNEYLTFLAGTSFKNSLNGVWLKAVFDVAAITILCTGIYFAIVHFQMPLANLVIFLFIFYRLAPKLSSSQSQVHNLLFAFPSLERINELWAEAVSMEEKGGNHRITGIKSSVSLKNIDFSYVPGKTTLTNINLNIPASDTIAVVGGSGAGKSTIIDLIMGLLEPNSGQVLIDGMDLKSLDLDSWRRLIGYVAQDTILFHATVRENIAWGLFDVPDEEIQAAAELAHAQEFISELPQGYETIIGDRGIKLSGGQRQRLALARALLRKPQLLILDEATSALDAESEKKIQLAIESLARSMTILIVSHRLATVKQANSIYVLENGQLVEEGTWKGLEEKRGRFHTLKSLQGLD